MGNAWQVAIEPARSDEGGKNLAGLQLVLVAPSGDQWDNVPVTRVAFARANSRHPDVPFDEQMDIELAKAQEAADVINTYLDERERDAVEAFDAVKGKVREIIGRARKPA